MGQFLTLKKIRTKLWVAKSKVLLLLNNNDPVFCTLPSSVSYFELGPS